MRLIRTWGRHGFRAARVARPSPHDQHRRLRTVYDENVHHNYKPIASCRKLITQAWAYTTGTAQASREMSSSHYMNMTLGSTALAQLLLMTTDVVCTKSHPAFCHSPPKVESLRVVLERSDAIEVPLDSSPSMSGSVVCKAIL